MAHGFMGNAYANMSEWSKAIGCYDKFIELNSKNAVAYKRRGDAYSMVGEAAKAVEDYTKAIELNPVFALAYSDRGWEYAYSIKDYDKAIADYTKAVELDKKSPAKEDLLHLYRDIKNQLDKAEKIFSAIDLPKNEYFLEQTLFELHKRNEGTARKHLLKALSLVEDGFTEDTQGGWVYFAAIVTKLGYGQWLLDILEEKEFDTILSPYFVAICALEIERTKNSKAAEIYLKNQAVEKSEPARMTIEVMKKYI
jgi:tetratricopeptide (TPR) repeat protein